MAAKPKEIPLEEGKFYHIYNRGNNREKIFFSEENDAYFLRLFNKYLSDYLHIYAFCLLPNHFHFLIQVKEAKVPPFENKEQLLTNAIALAPTDAIASSDGISTNPRVKEVKVPPFEKVEPLPGKKAKPLLNEKEKSFSNQVSFQFRKFFTAYSMAINKQQNRTGSLFQKNFKRIEITTESYLKQLILYIHTNPQRHGMAKDFTTYIWSSYQLHKKKFPINIEYNFVLLLFENENNYHFTHQQKVNATQLQEMALEEEA